MTAHDDLDQQLNAFLRDGPTDLPDPSFDAVRDRTEQTRQRVVLGPWRVPDMNKFLAVGLGAAAVVAVLLIGSNLLGSGSPTPGGPPESVAPSEAPSEPAPSAAASAPPLTQSFTSTQHGISLSYPEGWTAQAATEPWTDSTFPLEFGQPHADWLADPILGHNLFLTTASKPIGDATPEDWAAEQMASGVSGEGGCTRTEPVLVDGASGLIGTDECDIAVVATDGRGYWIQLYTSGDDPAAVAPYDKAWLEEVLATVQLHPEDAVN